jgi:hypothetical protein
MSVDVSAYFGKPAPLVAVADRAAWALAEILALRPETVPPVLVCAGWAAEAEAPLSRQAVEQMIVGRPLPDDCSEAFTVRAAGTADAAYLTIMDHADEKDRRYQVVGYAHPYRTCVGVVLALAVVLGIGIASDGRFCEDWQLPLRSFVDEPTDDPLRFIELTRMAVSSGHSGQDFAVRCEQFLRRFPRLGGWPQDRSLST